MSDDRQQQPTPANPTNQEGWVTPPLNIPQEAEAAPPEAPAIEQNPAQETAIPPTETEQQQAESGQPAPVQEEQPKSRSKTSEYIDRLHSRRREQETRAVAAEREVARLRERLSEAPEVDEFDVGAQAAHEMRQQATQDRIEDAEQAREDALRQRHDIRRETFQAKMSEASDRLPDAMEKFGRVKCSEFAAEFIVDSDNTAELAHWLGSNPAEAERIHSLEPAQQIRELARQEARISAAPKARKVSQAPAPTPQVSGVTSPSTKDPANMTQAEYSAWYRKRQGYND